VRAHRKRCASGFTLVEVLVVVVIIGLLASLVAVNLAPDARQSLREEGARLAALLAHARDEAITTGVPLAWQRTDGGYRFLERAPNRTWRPIASDSTLRQRDLPSAVRLAAVDVTVPEKGREAIIVLAPTGMSDPFRITLALGEHRVSVVSDGVGSPSLEIPRL
jgi:general secretion pathway protein H